MKIVRNLLLLLGLISLVIFACRRSLVLDDLIQHPEEVSQSEWSLVSGFELVRPEGSGDKCNPCHCDILGYSNNILQFAACDSLRATIKIKTEVKDWTFRLPAGADTFFEVTRKTGDSINYLSIMTKHLSSNGQSANLDLIATDADGKTNIIYSMILGQKPQPLICLKTTACTKPNSPNTCPNCVGNACSGTSSTTTTAATAQAPTYIQQKCADKDKKPQTDTLVLCKGAAGCGNKVYLSVITATQLTCKPCGASTNSNAASNPCEVQSNAADGTCSPTTTQQGANACVDRYSADESIWVASAHSTGDWLTIREVESVDNNDGAAAAEATATSVRASKKIKYLEVQAKENTTDKVRNDGIIEFRIVGGPSTPVFRVNVYQKCK